MRKKIERKSEERLQNPYSWEEQLILCISIIETEGKYEIDGDKLNLIVSRIHEVLQKAKEDEAEPKMLDNINKVLHQTRKIIYLQSLERSS